MTKRLMALVSDQDDAAITTGTVNNQSTNDDYLKEYGGKAARDIIRRSIAQGARSVSLSSEWEATADDRWMILRKRSYVAYKVEPTISNAHSSTGSIHLPLWDHVELLTNPRVDNLSEETSIILMFPQVIQEASI